MLKFTDEKGKERCLSELVSADVRKGQTIILEDTIRFVNYDSTHIFFVVKTKKAAVYTTDEDGVSIIIPNSAFDDWSFYDAKALVKFQAEQIEAQKKEIKDLKCDLMPYNYLIMFG